MISLRRVLAVLVLGLILGSAPASAQGLRIIPVPPGVTPRWTPLPGSPGVAYAPNIPTDVFRYKKTYYLYWDGMWFDSKSLEGPWKLPRKVPKAVRRIPPSFFKTAGRRAPHLPPGQPPPGPGQAFGPPTGARPWSTPDRGLAEPIPPADVTPPGWPPGPPPGQAGQEELMPGTGDTPMPGKQVPRAM